MIPVKIIRKPDDPQGVLRASLGGTREIGFYLVYRGDTGDILHLLAHAMEAIGRDITRGIEHPIAEEDGKHM
jgi:hypothetical protein